MSIYPSSIVVSLYHAAASVVMALLADIGLWHVRYLITEDREHGDIVSSYSRSIEVRQAAFHAVTSVGEMKCCKTSGYRMTESATDTPGTFGGDSNTL